MPRYTPRSTSVALLVVCTLAAAGLYFGWRLFWFMTDDAYIAFRYVSNSVLGLGYTWNPLPFRPVEGYTSFLWVVLLDGVWRIAGIVPPAAANTISLLFAYGTLVLSGWMLWRMALNGPLRRIRLSLLVLVLAGILSNRTFLAWTSSGLETAMFNFFVTAWVFSCLFMRPHTPQWLAAVPAAAVLTTLARPDGLLLVAATLFLLLASWWHWPGDASLTVSGRLPLARHYSLALPPIVVLVIYFLWRKARYGLWLPNTYYAKNVAAWPESGLRYLLSFIIEYSLWFWLALAVVFLLVIGRRIEKSKVSAHRLLGPRVLIPLTVTGTLHVHVAYYTLLIGGDHFEYRVYSHLIPLIFLSAVWLLQALNSTAGRTIAFMALFVVSSWPVPWTHWAKTHALDDYRANFLMRVPVAPSFPAFARPYVTLFDDVQAWLIEHYVGLRHQEHKLFHEYQLRLFPSREKGSLLSFHDYPVLVTGGAGMPGWVLPNVAIIDTHGLNDTIVARNPVDPGRPRRLAHERYPPVDYVACFQPNVQLVAANKLVVAQRDVTADTIITCERKQWPPGFGDAVSTHYLSVTYQNAPAVHDYLWSHWTSEPLYLYFVRPELANTTQNTALLQAFTAYTGPGCVVIPAEETNYLFAFLPAEGRPALSEVKTHFTWTRFVKDATFPYHIGYTARAGTETVPLPTQSAEALWDNQIQLLGFDLPRTGYRPGETIRLTLYYAVNGRPPPGQSFFVHLLGVAYNPTTGGPLWGQDDGEPCRGLFPMERWETGMAVVSKVAISIPATAPAGQYRVVTGFYNWQTGERTLLANESARPDGIDLGQISISGSP